MSPTGGGEQYSGLLTEDPTTALAPHKHTQHTTTAVNAPKRVNKCLPKKHSHLPNTNHYTNTSPNPQHPHTTPPKTHPPPHHQHHTITEPHQIAAHTVKGSYIYIHYIYIN